MSRRSGTSLQVLLGTAVVGLFVYGLYSHHDIQTRYRRAEEKAERLRQQHDSLSAQLQVVYEHKSRLEKSLQQEKADHRKTKSDSLQRQTELETKYENEKQELLNRITTINQEHKMLKSQHEDVQAELTRLNDQKAKLEEDHAKLTEQHNVEYQQMQQEKALEISALRDKVATLQRQNDNLESRLAVAAENAQQNQREKEQDFLTINQLNEENRFLQAEILRQKLLLQQKPDPSMNKVEPQLQLNKQAQNIQNIYPNEIGHPALHPVQQESWKVQGRLDQSTGQQPQQLQQLQQQQQQQALQQQQQQLLQQQQQQPLQQQQQQLQQQQQTLQQQQQQQLQQEQQPKQKQEIYANKQQSQHQQLLPQQQQQQQPAQEQQQQQPQHHQQELPHIPPNDPLQTGEQGHFEVVGGQPPMQIKQPGYHQVKEPNLAVVDLARQGDMFRQEPAEEVPKEMDAEHKDVQLQQVQAPNMSPEKNKTMTNNTHQEGGFLHRLRRGLVEATDKAVPGALVMDAHLKGHPDGQGRALAINAPDNAKGAERVENTQMGVKAVNTGNELKKEDQNKALEERDADDMRRGFQREDEGNMINQKLVQNEGLNRNPPDAMGLHWGGQGPMDAGAGQHVIEAPLNQPMHGNGPGDQVERPNLIPPVANNQENQVPVPRRPGDTDLLNKGQHVNDDADYDNHNNDNQQDDQDEEDDKDDDNYQGDKARK